MDTNREKSVTIYSMVCTREFIMRMGEMNGIQIRSFPIKYFGLLLTARKLKHNDCGALLASLEKMLSRWKGRELSYLGRHQLINCVFGRKVHYRMNATRLLKRQSEESI